MSRRSHLETVAQILETAKNGASKSRITRRCNLNYLGTEAFLSYLLETGFLRVGDSYHTTERGLQFLKAYQTLELLLNTRN